MFKSTDIFVQAKNNRYGDGWKIVSKELRQRLFTLTGSNAYLNTDQIYIQDNLINMRVPIVDWANEFKCYDALPSFFKEAVSDETEANAIALKDGRIAFHMLPVYFRKGREIVLPTESDELQGGIVFATQMRSGWTGPYMAVTYTNLAYTDAGLRIRQNSQIIPYYSGTRPIYSLPFRAPTADEKAALQTRGERYFDLNKRRAYMSADGLFSHSFSFWSRKTLHTRGRFIIDVNGFVRADTEMADFLSLRHRGEDSSAAWDDEGNESHAAEHEFKTMLWTCPSTVYGFSFQRKEWGRFEMGDLSEVKYREHAIDQLVLDPNIKYTLLALCKASGHVFHDIVDTKGDGINFILSGPPGVGKTLTAEAIAESLRRPLYVVGSGELGATPEHVEERLAEIVDLAEDWNAVVLLDEAEVFMVQRAVGDVTRNAMVSIFLRALEQHNTVLFLTTNRLDDIDPAFHSRISLSVTYETLSDESRVAVWRSLLAAAKLDPTWGEELGQYKLNGREIKHRIRIAQALAQAKQQDVSLRTVLDATAVAAQE